MEVKHWFAVTAVAGLVAQVPACSSKFSSCLETRTCIESAGTSAIGDAGDGGSSSNENGGASGVSPGGSGRANGGDNIGVSGAAGDTTCTGDLVECAPGVCTNTATDVANCGGCGKACGGTCTDGVCCPSGTTNCSGSCVNLQSDPENCLTCGHACGSGLVCEGGTCIKDCVSNTRCGNSCVDLQTDPNNCQACGTRCSPPSANGSAVCSGAAGCGIECNTGSIACGKTCCSPPAANSHAHASCVTNACQFQCDPNYHACSSATSTCYADTDAEHCGAGCLDCRQANASSSCKGGTQTACANTCLGTTISACTGVNGKPFCGTWEFESGTPEAEGWGIDPETTTVANPTLKISTARAYSGKSSLAIDYSGTGTDGQVVIRTSICGGQKVSYSLASTLTFQVRYETAPGSTPLTGYDYEGYVEAWNQNVVTSAGNDFNPVEGTWVYATAGGQFDFTDLGIVFRVFKPWKGTIYVDNIAFAP